MDTTYYTGPNGYQARYSEPAKNRREARRRQQAADLGAMTAYLPGDRITFRQEHPGRILNGTILGAADARTVRVHWDDESRRPCWPVSETGPEVTEVGWWNQRMRLHSNDAAEQIRRRLAALEEKGSNNWTEGEREEWFALGEAFSEETPDGTPGPAALARLFPMGSR